MNLIQPFCPHCNFIDFKDTLVLDHFIVKLLLKYQKQTEINLLQIFDRKDKILYRDHNQKFLWHTMDTKLPVSQMKNSLNEKLSGIYRLTQQNPIYMYNQSVVYLPGITWWSFWLVRLGQVRTTFVFSAKYNRMTQNKDDYVNSILEAS